MPSTRARWATATRLAEIVRAHVRRRRDMSRRGYPALRPRPSNACRCRTVDTPVLWSTRGRFPRTRWRSVRGCRLDLRCGSRTRPECRRRARPASDPRSVNLRRPCVKMLGPKRS
jgi:hypothetical protein